MAGLIDQRAAAVAVLLLFSTAALCAEPTAMPRAAPNPLSVIVTDPVTAVAPSILPSILPSIVQQDPVPIESLRVFTSVYERVRQNFVEPVSDEQLFDNAMAGLLSRLDPYSEFLDPQSYTRLLAFAEGDIAHAGLQVKPSADTWQISQISGNSSAIDAGIQVGDRLLRVDGKSTRSLTQQDIEQLLRGAIGSSVRLTIGRPPQRNRELSIRRIAPESHAVRYTIRSDGIVVLSMRAFQAHTGQQVLDVLEPLYQRPGALRGLILDIRDNPGGLLSSAVEIADYFLASGMIVSTKGRGEPEQRYQAVSEQRFADVPIMVLINRYSASAAEVLAGALQDHGRATVIGQTSYGKGSVQKLWPIEGGRAVKLTVSRYYTPKGRMIEGLGIAPDVLLSEASLPENRSAGSAVSPVSPAAEQDDALEQSILLMLQRLTPVSAQAPAPASSPASSPASGQPSMRP